MFSKFRRFVYRAWFYFRVGYGTYLALLIGVASNIIVIYKLSIVDVKSLDAIFPTLTAFTVFAVLVGTPIGVLVGVAHMKRTGAFAADASVQTEANPYMYKVIPGKEQEVFLPLLVLTARALSKIMEQQKTLTSEEREQFQHALSKADVLLKGGMVGHPRLQPV